MPDLPKSFGDFRFINIEGESYCSIRDKQSLNGTGAKEVADIVFWIIQIGFTRVGGITDQQKSHFNSLKLY
jgi:hypothetical protein